MSELKNSNLTTRFDTLLVDADDTIWHDSKYFRVLEGLIIKEMCQSGMPEAQAFEVLISAVAFENGGEEGFANAIRKLAVKYCANESVPKLIKFCLEFESHPIEVFPGAAEVISIISCRRKILLTKGIEAEQIRKLAASGLSHLFDQVIVSKKKNSDRFAEILAGLGVHPSKAVAIGNSIKHDIIPAVTNGASAIWLNHPENMNGRNGQLPDGVPEVAEWRDIFQAIKGM